MNDPHVVSLTYRLQTPSGVSYENPPSVSVTRPEFRVELRDDECVVTLLAHYGITEDARAVVEPLLRAWELDSALAADGRPLIRFIFERPEVVDRHPPPPGTPVTVAATGVAAGTAVGSASAVAVHRSYPSPPKLRITADVEMLWFRYSLYKEGRDSITAMGYFCFSHLLWLANGAAATSRMFAVDDDVLDNLSRLTSGVGDKTTARKRHRKMEWRPHTDQELQWIDAAVRMLIRRLGEHAAGASLRTLTMADLPPVG